MVLRLKCSTQNYLCQINYTSLIFSSIEMKMIMSSTVPQDENQLFLGNIWNSMNINYIIRHAWKDASHSGLWKRIFISTSNFKEKHSEIAMCICLYGFHFGAVVLNPDCNESHVLLPAVCSEKDLVDLCHTGLFCGEQKPLHHQMCFCQEAQGPWAQERVLASFPLLLEPNTEAAERWSVYQTTLKQARNKGHRRSAKLPEP